MAILWVLIGAALVVAISVFHAYNPAVVDLSLYGYPVFDVPMWLVLTVPTVIGVLIGILMALPGRIRAAWAARRLSTQLSERDQALGSLRQRVAELERDLALARTERPVVPAPEDRLSDVPDTREPLDQRLDSTTSDVNRAA